MRNPDDILSNFGITEDKKDNGTPAKRAVNNVVVVNNNDDAY